MADEADKIGAVRDRLLLLVLRHAGAAAKFRTANRPELDEVYKRASLPRLKPATGIVSGFPVIDEIKIGRTQFEAFQPSADYTLDLDAEDGDPVRNWVQDYEIVVFHENLNVLKNASEDRLILAALDAGRRQLKDPATPASELAYVTYWGGVVVNRSEEMYREGPRGASRFLIPVTMDLKRSEYLGA